MSSPLNTYGSLSRIRKCVSPYYPRHILLVTGRGSFEACGAKAILDTELDDYQVTRFYDFEINPKLEDAVHGAKLAIESEIDLILAVGGGSPMDIAKLIKAFMPDVENSEKIAKGNIAVTPSSIPLITVPTTAGSGSEATHFAVVYIGKDKYSLASPDLSPQAYILDGQLLRSASPYQRAVNGLDAMAQALEGAWAVNSTKESRRRSYKALALLVKSLPTMVKSDTPSYLQNVLLAAHLAGQVINTTKTTAAHAFSYAFSSYHDVPHGHAVWMTLPAIFSKHLTAEDSA
ncbi:MAG: iron-containing alcohol dehydrogenase, partial [Acidimicrobiales bacterium]